MTIVFRTIIQEQSMDAFAGYLKKAGIKDLMLFFPPTKRDDKHLEAHFKAAGLSQVVDWYTKRKYAAIKERVITHLKEAVEGGESSDAVSAPLSCLHIIVPYRRALAQMVEFLKTSQAESPLPEPELVHCIWQSLMSSVDWSIARADQIESMVLKEVKVRAWVTAIKTAALTAAIREYLWSFRRSVPLRRLR